MANDDVTRGARGHTPEIAAIQHCRGVVEANISAQPDDELAAVVVRVQVKGDTLELLMSEGAAMRLAEQCVESVVSNAVRDQRTPPSWPAPANRA